MSKYLTGHQVIASLNIAPFELLALAKKGTLRPFTLTGKPVRDIQEERALINSEAHRLDTLRLKRGEFEVGTVMTGMIVKEGRLSLKRKSQNLKARALCP